MFKNIITNGSFTQGGVFSFDNWIAHNVKLTIPSNPYLDTIFHVEGKSTISEIDTVPPGIYQKIKINKEYTLGATLNFKYTISYKSDVALSRKEDLKANFYIYAIDPNCSASEIRTISNVRRPTYTKYTSIYYDESDALKNKVLTEESEFTVTLYPGEYVIGFGTDYISSSSTFMSDANKISGLGIIEIEAILDEEVYQQESTLPFTTKNFTASGVDTITLYPNEIYDLPVEREGLDIGIKAISNYTVDQQKQRKCGFFADFDIAQYSDEDPDDLKYMTRISFWYRYSEYLNSSTDSGLAVYLYDKDTGYQFLYDKIRVTQYWALYTTEVDLWDGRFEILIIPSKDTYINENLYLVLNNIEISLRIYSKANGNPIGGEGTLANPYNSNDGYLNYEIADYGSTVTGKKTIYKPYFDTDMPLRSQVYFVKIKGKYYMTRGTRTHYLCNQGFHNFDGYIVGDPKNNSGMMRYFYRSGEMAINEYFCENEEDIYIADEQGICHYSCKILKSMNLSINDLPITGTSIVDIPRNKKQYITATFEEQSPPIQLKIKSSDENIIQCTKVNKNIIYGNAFALYDSNKSNTLEIQGINAGVATITVSYESITGSIVETSFIMEVRDQAEYPEDLKIEMPHKTNYIISGQEFQIKHRLTPIISSDLPLYWYSDSDFLTVTNDGIVKASEEKIDSPKTGNIKVINYGSGITETCQITLMPDSYVKSPIKINIARNGIDYTSKVFTMTIGESTDFDDITLDKDEKSKYVFQNTIWSSNRPSVAMVDQFGTVTALKAGTARISCTCVKDAYVKSWVDVEVKPDEASQVLRNIELNTPRIVIFNSEDSSSNKYSQEYLTCIYTPSNTKQKDVIWSSDDTSIAKVDESGRVYCDPVSDSNNGKTTTIKCTSAYNSSIFATCEVTTYNWESYEPIVCLEKNEINGCVNEQLTISYALSNCDYIEYIKDSITIKMERIEGYPITTTNTASFNESQKRIFVDLKEAGTFRLIISLRYKKLGDDTTYYLTDTCTIKAVISSYTPVVTKGLEAQYVLHDGSYVLRYDVVNEVAENFECYLSIDGTQSEVYAEPLIYNNERYFYIFEKMDYPGTFHLEVKIINNGIYTANAGTITITIPENEDNQKSLGVAKQDYDKATNEIIDLIKTLITDRAITANEKSEFTTRFKLFNVNYDNMKTMLDMCIDYIDAKIKEEQATMSTMATALASDGIEVAAYSIEENTNSNYSNVTDMDYYQNECIKALMQRVLELEERMNELANNNDN